MEDNKELIDLFKFLEEKRMILKTNKKELENLKKLEVEYKELLKEGIVKEYRIRTIISEYDWYNEIKNKQDFNQETFSNYIEKISNEIIEISILKKEKLEQDSKVKRYVLLSSLNLKENIEQLEDKIFDLQLDIENAIDMAGVHFNNNIYVYLGAYLQEEYFSYCGSVYNDFDDYVYADTWVKLCNPDNTDAKTYYLDLDETAWLWNGTGDSLGEGLKAFNQLENKKEEQFRQAHEIINLGSFNDNKELRQAFRIAKESFYKDILEYGNEEAIKRVKKKYPYKNCRK